MGLHLFISVCLGIVGTLVSAAFGLTPGMSALVGLVVFLLYWGVCIIIVDLDDL
jgi:hypothetical protein